MAELSTKGPFYAKDSAGTMQKIKVIDLSGSLPEVDDDLIAGYAYVEMTGSSLDALTGSREVLLDISSSLSNIDLAGLDNLSGINEKLDAVTASVDNNSTYVEQIFRFNRATNIFSKILKTADLFDEELHTAKKITLHTLPELNPYSGMLEQENYFSKAIEVIIQNSTNKNIYLSISYDPAAVLNLESYTIKIPPGVIYNSESKIAHMIHKITFEDSAYETLVGEVACTIAYNSSLNHDLSVGETSIGSPYISSIATSFFNMPFIENNRYVVAEWKYISGSTPDGYGNMSVKIQARITHPEDNQRLTLYVTNADLNDRNIMYEGDSVIFEQEVPEELTLNYNAPPTGRYELIAQVSGSGDIGDARILFADLIRRSG